MKKMMVEVGGKAYPCRLTMGAMLLYKQNTGEDVSQLGDGADLEKMLTLMWCCIKSASRADGVEFDMDFDLFCDMVTPEDMAEWNTAIGQDEDEEKKSKA